VPPRAILLANAENSMFTLTNFEELAELSTELLVSDGEIVFC
jgi:hypothetical protein